MFELRIEILDIPEIIMDECDDGDYRFQVNSAGHVTYIDEVQSWSPFIEEICTVLEIYAGIAVHFQGFAEDAVYFSIDTDLPLFLLAAPYCIPLLKTGEQSDFWIPMQNTEGLHFVRSGSLVEITCSLSSPDDIETIQLPDLLIMLERLFQDFVAAAYRHCPMFTEHPLFEQWVDFLYREGILPPVKDR